MKNKKEKGMRGHVLLITTPIATTSVCLLDARVKSVPNALGPLI